MSGPTDHDRSGCIQNTSSSKRRDYREEEKLGKAKRKNIEVERTEDRDKED